MKYQSNGFGGILLQLESGNIAVNGGGTLAEMEHAYIVDGKTPLAMIVTCEHHQRSHNADRFCLKYDVPLITTHLCAERLFLDGIKTHLLSVSESTNKVFKNNCKISNSKRIQNLRETLREREILRCRTQVAPQYKSYHFSNFSVCDLNKSPTQDIT